MKRRGKSSFPSKYVLLLLTVICIMLLFAGYATGYAGEPIRTICNYVFVPMQKGLDYVGESISINSDDTKTKEQLIAENEQLQEQIDELSTQLTNTRLQQSELDTLLSQLAVPSIRNMIFAVADALIGGQPVPIASGGGGENPDSNRRWDGRRPDEEEEACRRRCLLHAFKIVNTCTRKTYRR